MLHISGAEPEALATRGARFHNDHVHGKPCGSVGPKSPEVSWRQIIIIILNTLMPNRYNYTCVFILVLRSNFHKE